MFVVIFMVLYHIFKPSINTQYLSDNSNNYIPKEFPTETSSNTELKQEAKIVHKTVKRSHIKRPPIVPPKRKSNRFKCDRRQYCSQMTSCAEAKYFLANCRNPKMDGDGDGIPCERQWCGR